MITHKQSTEIIGTIKKIPESLVDFYQVMKFCGEEIDSLNMETESSLYWDLNNLWWSAAENYNLECQKRRMN